MAAYNQALRAARLSKSLGTKKGHVVNEDLRRITEFIVELDKLKAVLRKTKPVGLERYENSAEHSWQVCLLAVLLGEYAAEPVDVVRVVEILLVHDIPEIDAGDHIVYERTHEVTAAAEYQAAQRIFGRLPEPHSSWCMARWQEYEARESNEAKFAYAMDRLMPVLQNLRNEGQSWRENGVSPERVLSINSPIGEACPTVWEDVQKLITEAAAAGIFRDTTEIAQPGAAADATKRRG